MNIHHHAHYCLPLLPVLDNMNSVHTPIPCFFEIYLNIIPSGLLPSDFLIKFFYVFLVGIKWINMYRQNSIFGIVPRIKLFFCDRKIILYIIIACCLMMD